jgi:hypothetical protein
MVQVIFFSRFQKYCISEAYSTVWIFFSEKISWREHVHCRKNKGLGILRGQLRHIHLPTVTVIMYRDGETRGLHACKFQILLLSHVILPYLESLRSPPLSLQPYWHQGIRIFSKRLSLLARRGRSYPQRKKPSPNLKSMTHSLISRRRSLLAMTSRLYRQSKKPFRNLKSRTRRIPLVSRRRRSGNV